MSTSDLTPPSPMPATFPGATVVQLIAGDPERPGALVAPLHPATVVLDDRRITATEGDIEWSWRLDDLESVHHSPDGSWSILAVPGVSDHGVALPPGDAAEFRRRLDALRSGGAPPAEAPESDPRRERDLPRDPGETVLVDLDAPPEDVDLPTWPASADVTIPGIAVASAAAAVDVAAPAGPGASLDPEAQPSGDRLRRRLRRTPRGRRSPSTEVVAPAGSPALAGLEARNISAWFGDHNVLDRVSLDMPAGEVTALIGPSGCGKSTFLRILNRMHELIPSAALAGEVLLDGQDVYDPSRKLTDARRQIGMVFQKPNPFPAMSIYDNVVASLRLTGTKATTDEKDELVESCLSKAGLWNEVRDRLRQPGGGLSGGQQQRLCIARALAIRPRVLLMDEPCSALDPTSTRRIEQTIQELASEVTIVIVTHNMQQAQRVSHRCAFFLAEAGTPGVIVEHGPTDAMFHAPQDSRTNDYVNGRFG
jgi:phosphate transport system ATP-binding protein